MKLKIAILEIAMLIGICVSATLLPRSFPFSWFIAISLGVLVLANVILFRALKGTRVNGGTVYRIGPKAYVGLGIIILYWLLIFLRHKSK